MREAVNDSPLVIKFGGTSVGGGAAFSRAASIAAEAARGRPVAVGVPAMSGGPNLLLGHASGVVDTDGRATGELREALAERHLRAIREAVAPERQPAVEGRASERS